MTDEQVQDKTYVVLSFGVFCFIMTVAFALGMLLGYFLIGA